MSKHAIERALTKYKLVLTFDDIDILVNKIYSGDSVELVRNKCFKMSEHGSYQSIHKIRYKHKLLYIVLLEEPDRYPVIKTFLTHDEVINRIEPPHKAECNHNYENRRNRLDKTKHKRRNK